MKKIDYKSKLATCYFAVLLGSMICLAGCGQEEKIGLDPTDGIAPAQPTDISVENISGGAIISYTPPKDDDLLCVMASYTINDVTMTAKASPYVNHLKVEGFGKEGTYEIKLKSVDKSKNESEPILVTVNPTTPPVVNIFNTLKVVDSFGGMRLTWENETETNIIVEVLQKDGDTWTSKENFYSNAKEGKASIRGLAPELITFGYRIRDRWDNFSEIKEQESLPLLETQIDKSLFREITALPGDASPHPSLPVRYIWDGNTVANCFHGSTGDIGKTITFDLGQIAKISRFKMWQRTESADWIYNHNNLKRYTIYGCNEITEDMLNSGKDVNGEILPTFEGWNKIMDVECYKPSGDSGKVTNEDKEYILNGDEHEVPIEAPSFRYIRIHMLESWSGGAVPQIGEMTFWGQVVE